MQDYYYRPYVKHEIGEAFKGTSENSKITQLYGDSREFDFSPWYGQCDFVWIDACHDYRHSAWWSGVTRCVRQLQSKYPEIRHVRGTTIALLRKTGDIIND